PRHFVGAAPLKGLSQTPVRAFVRALRRLSARRSSSLIPPHTPESCPVLSAHDKHSVVTAHRLQTSFASAICARAGPLFPTGKNSSGSSSRQTALWSQSIGPISLLCAQQGARAFLRLLTRALEMFLHCCFRCFHRLNRCQYSRVNKWVISLTRVVSRTLTRLYYA